MKRICLALLISVMSLLTYAHDFPFKVTVSGQGARTLIFLPGFACSDEVWESTVAAYEKDFTCVRLTMPGFAGVAPEASPSFEGWKTAIAAFIRKEKMDKPLIIGHSMGGCLAMAIAADYPDLPGGIVVVDALPALAAMMDPDFKSNPHPDCAPAVNQIMALSESQFSEMQKSNMPRMLATASKTELVLGWSLKSDRRTFAEVFCDFSNVDLRDRISKITCPSLILFESYFVNFKSTIEDQYKQLSTARMAYATKGLHFIMYDDPEWFEEQLRNFIKK